MNKEEIRLIIMNTEDYYNIAVQGSPNTAVLLATKHLGIEITLEQLFEMADEIEQELKEAEVL